MKNNQIKFLRLSVVVFFAAFTSVAQSVKIDLHNAAPKVSTNLSRAEDTLKKQFEAKKLIWPPKEMYVRSFKYDRAFEVWIKDNDNEPFKLFKTYKVCMQSGTMGPKRMEGDFQVPEGFYYINEFNPNSNYHLSLGLNYPNAADKIVCDSLHLRPGNSIYIHGDCVSSGCIPLSNEPIEEVYLMAYCVKAQGEDFIPVHVFPIRYNVKKSEDYLTQFIKDNPPLQHFAEVLKTAYDYFETKKELPLIMINKNGQYIIHYFDK